MGYDLCHCELFHKTWYTDAKSLRKFNAAQVKKDQNLLITWVTYHNWRHRVLVIQWETRLSNLQTRDNQKLKKNGINQKLRKSYFAKTYEVICMIKLLLHPIITLRRQGKGGEEEGLRMRRENGGKCTTTTSSSLMRKFFFDACFTLPSKFRVHASKSSFHTGCLVWDDWSNNKKARHRLGTVHWAISSLPLPVQNRSHYWGGDRRSKIEHVRPSHRTWKVSRSARSSCSTVRYCSSVSSICGKNAWNDMSAEGIRSRCWYSKRIQLTIITFFRPYETIWKRLVRVSVWDQGSKAIHKIFLG